MVTVLFSRERWASLTRSPQRIRRGTTAPPVAQLPVIVQAFKYRLYPTKAQITTLENDFSMCRHLWNWNLEERLEAYQQNGETIRYQEQQNKLPKLKEERPWFKTVHSQVLQDVLHRLDNAYQAFFRRVQEGEEKPGFPKFKKRGQWDSITYPQYDKPPAEGIAVPKVGTINMVLHRELPLGAKVKTLTISKEGDKWFACFSCEVPLAVEPKQGLLSVLSIDVGLVDFYYASDDSHVPAPKYFRRLEQRLARLQRRFAKAERYSPKWYRLLKAIQKTHYQIRCQREDFLHKTANELLDKADVLVYEDLKIRNLRKRAKPKPDATGKYLPNGAAAKSGLNKSIADAGWGKFLELLKYKARARGKAVIAVPPHYTSQECSNCGQIVKKALSIRTHRCECGYVANRDLNAAHNILRIGLDTLAGLPA